MSLKALPNEIKREIVGYLELSTLKLGHEHPGNTYIEHRAALRSLCLVSRDFLQHARPLLYGTVVIFHPNKELNESTRLIYGLKTMILLTRTLTHNHGLRPLIKYIACPLTLYRSSWCEGYRYRWFDGELAHYITMDPEDWREGELATLCWESSKPDFSDVSESDRRIFDIAGLDLGPSMIDIHHYCDFGEGIAEKILGALLCLTPELGTMLLQVSRPHTIMEHILRTAMKDNSIEVQVLPKLTAIRIQVFPRAMYFAETVRLESIHFLLSLPSVSDLHTWGDTTSFLERAIAGEMVAFPDALSKIQAMDFSETFASSRQIFHILRFSPRLRKISVALRYGHFSVSIPDQSETMAAAIRSHGTELEEFRLRTYVEPFVGRHLSVSNRLDSLQHMDNLRVLDVELHALFYQKSELDRLQLYRLLPPNLERLDLCENWYPTDDPFTTDYDEDSAKMSNRLYEELMVSQFHELATVRSERLLHLKSIHLWPREVKHYSRELQMSEDSLVSIKVALLKAGVSFTWSAMITND